MTLENNKYTLSPEELQQLGVRPGDRVSITYKERNGKYVPIIQKDFTGNSIMVNGSVRFRGVQNGVLRKFGTEFNIVGDELVPHIITTEINNINYNEILNKVNHEI